MRHITILIAVTVMGILMAVTVAAPAFGHKPTRRTEAASIVDVPTERRMNGCAGRRATILRRFRLRTLPAASISTNLARPSPAWATSDPSPRPALRPTD